MRKTPTTEQPVAQDGDLESKVKAADPMVKEYVSQLIKENDRLQKLRVKDEVRHQSESSYLHAKIAELEKHPVTVVIERTHTNNPPENS